MKTHVSLKVDSNIRIIRPRPPTADSGETKEVILMDKAQNQKTKLEIPPEVRSFLEGLLSDANMTTLDDGMREEMINELFARLDSYMASIIVDKMPPEHLDEFIKMNEEKKSRAEIETFLKEKMPNAQDVLTKAFMNFRDMYLRNVSIARSAPDKGGNN